MNVDWASISSGVGGRDKRLKNLTRSQSKNHLFYTKGESYVVIDVRERKSRNVSRSRSKGRKSKRKRSNQKNNFTSQRKKSWDQVDIYGYHEDQHDISNLAPGSIRARVQNEKLFLVDDFVDGKIKTMIYNFDSSHHLIKNTFFYNDKLYKPLSYHAVVSFFSNSITFMDYYKYFNIITDNRHINVDKIKRKVELLIHIGEDAFILGEIYLKMSQTICLLNDTELLKKYLHTFYTKFTQDEAPNQKIRKLNLLKAYCKKLNLPKFIATAIDQVIEERSLDHPTQDTFCVDKEEPKEPIFRDEHEFKSYIKRLKFEQRRDNVKLN